MRQTLPLKRDNSSLALLIGTDPRLPLVHWLRMDGQFIPREPLAFWPDLAEAAGALERLDWAA